MIKRKDAIIRVRNAQVAALWDELHIKEPWRNALQSEARIGLPDDPQTNKSRALVVIAINSVSPSQIVPILGVERSGGTHCL